MNDELKELIKHKLDIDEFLDIIGYDLTDLVEKLSEEIEEYKEDLMDACQ